MFFSSKTFCSDDVPIVALAGHEDMPATISLNRNLIMTDILYILASIAFFALMIAFIWACEKV